MTNQKMGWIMVVVGAIPWSIAALSGEPGGWAAGLLFFGPALPFFLTR